MNWEIEEWKCIDHRARTVEIPPDGESERVGVLEVIKRKVWFPEGGLYVMRDGERVMYIGLTAQPLGVRLRGALANRKTWTRADYSTWTVTMQRAPARYGEDIRRLRALIAEHGPRFNILGRPRRDDASSTRIFTPA